MTSNDEYQHQSSSKRGDAKDWLLIEFGSGHKLWCKKEYWDKWSFDINKMMTEMKYKLMFGDNE
jgi:hypothetical protein